MKTQRDIEKAMKDYYDKFGVNYGIACFIDDATPDAIVKNIEECIKTNTPKPEPIYEDGVEY